MRCRIASTVTTLIMVTMLGAGIAQAQQPAPPQRPIPPPNAVAPPPEVPKAKEIEGTVSKVDPTARTLGVSTGLFGLLGATMRVGDNTQIRVDGQPATLADVKRGDRVKASYEVLAGSNNAKSIDVTSPAKERSTASRTGSTTP